LLGTASDRLRFRRAASPAEGTAQAHHVADDLGDRLVVLGRDLLVDLDRRVQGARDRRVLDDRDIARRGDLADLADDGVDALGDNAREVTVY
jgi:hypothetical protein